MHLYTDKDLKRLKITLWVILMVVIVVIIMLLRSFLKDTKKIWDYPGISNSAKMSIALHDSNWIDDVYTIDSGEKFIVVAHFMFIAGECHVIYDYKGNWIVNMNKEYSDNTRIEIIPAEKTNPPNKWLVKGDRKEDDILIIHNANGKYEVKYKK